MKKICTICKQEKKTTEFHKNKTKRDGLQSKCKSCSSELGKSYYQSNPLLPEVIHARNRRRRYECKQFVFDYLSTHPCVDCGEKDPVVLEFDHVGKKRMSINKMMASYTIGAISKEIEKCEIRCANCHRRKTYHDQGSYRLWMTKND